MMGFSTMPGASYDSLIGGAEVPIFNRNVQVSSDTTLERGAILAGVGIDSDMTVHLATSADTVGRMLFIAAEDVEAQTATTVFTSGRFNRTALTTESDTSVADFEAELRRQGIYLTEVI